MLGGHVAWDASLPLDYAIQNELQKEDEGAAQRDPLPERDAVWGRGDAGYGKGSSWDMPGAALIGVWMGSGSVSPPFPFSLIIARLSSLCHFLRPRLSPLRPDPASRLMTTLPDAKQAAPSAGDWLDAASLKAVSTRDGYATACSKTNIGACCCAESAVSSQEGEARGDRDGRGQEEDGARGHPGEEAAEEQGKRRLECDIRKRQVGPHLTLNFPADFSLENFSPWRLCMLPSRVALFVAAW